MTATGPLATVVIPTHNRAVSVLATLGALAQQDCGPELFEVVAVPNGCTDDTVARLVDWPRSYRLRVVEIDAPGASAARNTGAEHARAPVLIFVDDDVVPAPSFVSAHLAAHGVRPGEQVAPVHGRVAIGYLPALLQDSGDRFAITLRAWWEAMFDRIRQPGHRFSYADLLSGNFSLSRETFFDVGGFDTSLRCHEDYELGYRLIAAGAQFVFAEDACGTHADMTRLPRACERKREEGRADVQMVQHHPQVRLVLPMARPRTLRQRLVRGLAFHLPSVGDAGVRAMTALLPPLDAIGATSSWLRVVYAVFGYWYERGLADAVGTRGALRQLLSDPAGAPPDAAEGIEIDLAGGLRSALHEVDRLRPLAVTILVGRRRIAQVPWQPGAERLTGRHVASTLVLHHHRIAFEALRKAGHVRLTASLPTAGYDTQVGHAAGAPSDDTADLSRSGSRSPRDSVDH
jgi:GT2 family glycosyltransferase